MFRSIKLYGTTDSSGDLTVTSGNIIHAKVHAVQWIDGDFVNGVDAVISVVNDDGQIPDNTLLTLTDADDDAWYYLRYVAQDATGADVNTAGDVAYAQPVADGKLKLVVSSGGDTKSGGCVVYFES